ncbi:unnamed protein product [Bursaphelenchus okinawaensis]|uniref:Uncharacterized protein n=1 Tax=Bursaphelenchus okinawaensis TaxID=465554 RepID=A0A811LQ89_9BILA|nr:unnamed protein product [Bursaphelenchus okinawaensis]CAG9126358.1 unnamed protein product [Bursaphelenchus okinawaensis]
MDKDKYSPHRYISMFSRSQKELHIKDMKTGELFKLCNVPTNFFGRTILEETGLFHVIYKLDGYDTIQFYDIKTRQKIFERSYVSTDKSWYPLSNYALFNYDSGEYIIYNPRKRQFYSRFINCLYPESHEHISPEGMFECRFSSIRRTEGRRCFDYCILHKSTFYFDYTKDKLRLMPIDVDETAYVDEICNQCGIFLKEHQNMTITALAVAMKQFFVTKIQLLKTRPAIPKVTKFNNGFHFITKLTFFRSRNAN